MATTAATADAVHFDQVLLAGGWTRATRIIVQEGLIAAIETDVPPQPADERAAIGLPGMANLHSHAFQRGMAGLAEVAGPGGDSFWSWRELMYRFVGRLDPDSLRAIAALAYAEMLESGFTRVGEFHYLHHAPDGAPFADPAAMTQAIVAAAEDTGIALTHLPVFYAQGGFGGAAPTTAQRRFVTDIDQFARILEGARAATAGLPDAVVGVAPHSLRAVTQPQLEAVAALAQGAPVHIHIAEQTREVEDCLAWSGQRPVEWLLDHAAVDASWCLVHATHVTEAEVAAIARCMAVVGLCPITEANLGDGLFPVARYRAQEGRFGIGSDSNVMIDMSEELRWLEYGQRLTARARNIVGGEPGLSTGAALFGAALTGGAQALGAPGGLAVGHPADMIALDAGHPSLCGRGGDALLDSLVFAAGRSAVATVWRRGHAVVRDGRHVDRERIAARYRRTLEALLA